MKVVAISDVHGDAVTAGVRRFPEVERSVRDAEETAIREEAGAFVFCGDLCDPDAGVMMVWCIELAIDVARNLELHGIPSIWIAGNHDVGNEGEGTTTIDPLNALAAARTKFSGSTLVHVATEPRPFIIRGVEFLCLPYPSHATAYEPTSAVAPTRGGRGSLVVLSHLQVRGMIPGEESTEMPRGRDVWLPEEEILVVSKLRPTIVLNGHYHRRQLFTTGCGLSVQVVGSIATFSHGEDRGTPGYLVVDVPG